VNGGIQPSGMVGAEAPFWAYEGGIIGDRHRRVGFTGG